MTKKLVINHNQTSHDMFLIYVEFMS